MKITDEMMREIINMYDTEPRAHNLASHTASMVDGINDIYFHLRKLRDMRIEAYKAYEQALANIDVCIKDLQRICPHLTWTSHLGGQPGESYQSCEVCGKRDYE